MGGDVVPIAAVALGLIIGLVIGGLGGGGGVLTVPALVYLLGQTAQDATTGSVLIVGTSALVGTVMRIRGRGLDWRTGLTFGAVGVPLAYLGSVLNQQVDQTVLLLAFAAITILAAVAMLLHGPADHDADNPPTPSSGPGVAVLVRPPTVRVRRLVRIGNVVAWAAAVGFLTGFLGVGGGFLLVPVLVIVLRMPIARAAGTSLLIMVLNAVAALGARAGELSLDWYVIVPFAIASVAGTLLGKRVADQLSGTTITRAFAVMLLLVGLAVGFESVLT
jgi:uncharacterized protein